MSHRLCTHLGPSHVSSFPPFPNPQSNLIRPYENFSCPWHFHVHPFSTQHCFQHPTFCHSLLRMQSCNLWLQGKQGPNIYWALSLYTKTKLSPFRYPVLLVVPPTLPHSYYVSIIEMKGLQPSRLSKCSTYECRGHCGMEIGVGQSSNCCACE